jgi:glutamyl-tRNA reductase
MKIAVIGINHATAPVKIRERLALTAEQMPNLLQRLREEFSEAEFLVLSTCNRVELYCASKNGGLEPDQYARRLCQFCGAAFTVFKKHSFLHRNAAAVEHLLAVTASLDSMIIGEPQILSQVKESYRLACQVQTAGKTLHRLLHCAFTTSKEIYATTSIAQRRVSVAGVAVQLAARLFKPLAAARIAVIGAGEMGELLIRHFLELGCRKITIFNRTRRRADRLAERLAVTAAEWDALPGHVKKTDIIVAAAQADQPLFDASFLPGKRRTDLLIIDIAVPRNFDPAVKKLPGVHLHTIDDLAQIAKENLNARREDLDQARRIIADNVESFMDWFGVMDIGPLIGRLRDNFHAMTLQELQRIWSADPAFSPVQKQLVEATLDRIVNKMLHQLIQNLHAVARTRGADEAARLIHSHLAAAPVSQIPAAPCPAKP